MMKNSWLLTSLFLIITLITSAQSDVNESSDLEVSLELINPSKEINDGVARIDVKGGVAPYQYKWSKQSSALDSYESKGLTEGLTYSVQVTDSKGRTSVKDFKIPAEVITEIVNSKVQPAVDFLGGILFWDPFAATGIYDPVVYTNEKEIPVPGWNATTNTTYVLKSWLVEEGAKVSEGDKIAIVTGDSGEEIDVFSDVAGTINFLFTLLITKHADHFITFYNSY